MAHKPVYGPPEVGDEKSKFISIQHPFEILKGKNAKVVSRWDEKKNKKAKRDKIRNATRILCQLWKDQKENKNDSSLPVFG